MICETFQDVTLIFLPIFCEILHRAESDATNLYSTAQFGEFLYSSNMYFDGLQGYVKDLKTPQSVVIFIKPGKQFNVAV